ncbi:MAG: site-specific integrase, partial [Herbinix sp.]|nr:site-specific integrase [Herbinix sp.]
ELKVLFDLVENDHILKPAVYLAGTLGLRRGEITGLKWENVDFENRIIYIKEARVRAGNEIIAKKTKNISSTRKLAMSTILYKKLCEVKSMRNDTSKNHADDNNIGYVVIDEKGDPINPAYLSARFGRFIKSHGLPHITLHGLRHSVASLGNYVGLTLFDISKILGHGSVDTTGRIYMHTFADTHSEALDKINDVLK